MSLEPVDVVVIGSGAGGAPVAWELARAGASVVILEKGRALGREELDHDEVKMCRRDLFVPYPHLEPHTLRHGEDGRMVRTNEAWTSNVVGGGTVHMSGYFMRMHPVDFRLRSTLGEVPGANLADWPISYADLEPYYARAEKEVGVSGRWRAHPFEEPRKADYPMPPMLEHPMAQKIDEAGRRLGLHPFPTPRAILTVPRYDQNRNACMYCALCGSYGCEVAAKSSTAVSLLPAALKTGRCELRPESMAVEIPVDESGRATGVVYRDKMGQRYTQPARFVVVACTAVESARLLLMSRSGRFPNGLGNDHGQVGRNLVFSGLTKAHGIFPHHPDRPWLREPQPFIQRSMQDFYMLPRPVDGLRKAGTILFDFYHPNPINNAERVSGRGEDALWGLRLKQGLRDKAANARCVGFETFAEFLPTPGSYVDLDPRIQDRFGLPAARITIERHPLDVKAMRLLGEQGTRVLEALGATDIEFSVRQGETKILQGGTCRFGRDPKSSVLDPSCRMHAVPNVYVSDGSFLPTSGGVPLTLTILANAFRVGENLARAIARGRRPG